MGRGAARLEVRWPRDGHDRDAAVCVGFSGGLDSTVLLHALHATEPSRRGDLTAVHVHHGLSPNADRWADHCAEECGRLGVALEVVRVRVDPSGGEGLEAEARRLRYEVYARRPEAFVALAHHRDDQAETVLLQLLRGTGVKGAAAMPAMRPLNERVTLYRPLLGYPRAALETHAREAGLRWIEDESNAERLQDRNYRRHAVAPLLDARFPSWRDSFARFASHAADAQALLEELARIDGAGASLAIDASLSPVRRANAVRRFLSLNGLAMPSDARLAEIARQLYEARGDANVRIEHDGTLVTRFRGAAHVEPAAAPMSRIPWNGEARIELGDSLGAIDFEQAIGAGVAAARACGADWYVAPRQGGERLRLAPGRPSRTLKNLLQEHGVAPVRRERMPLLFHGERLVWAPGVGIAAEYACPPGEPGLRPLWRVAGKGSLC
jgi:tRNA(Ile)-lysidine synthase